MARRVLKYRQQIERLDELPDLRAFDLALQSDDRDDHLEHARIIDAAHRETRRKQEAEIARAEQAKADADEWDRRFEAARERRLIAGREGQAVILKSSEELRAEAELRAAREDIAAARYPMHTPSTMMAGSYMAPNPVRRGGGATHAHIPVYTDHVDPLDYYSP